MHFDYVPHFYISRFNLLVVTLSSKFPTRNKWVERLLIEFVIDLFVSLESLEVIPGFLEKGHGQNKGQGGNIGEEEANFEGRD
jgi:hypothetical protein